MFRWSSVLMSLWCLPVCPYCLSDASNPISPLGINTVNSLHVDHSLKWVCVVTIWIVGFFPSAVYSNALQESANSILYNGLIEELVDVLQITDRQLVVRNDLFSFPPLLSPLSILLSSAPNGLVSLCHIPIVGVKLQSCHIIDQYQMSLDCS